MKVTNYDTSSLSEAGKYYNDGLVLLSVEKQEKLVEVLNELLLKKETDEGYHWEKSLNSYALRPQAYDYHNSVLDFLFDNKLPLLLERYSERKLVLSHIQITKTEPGRSYQDWHRDSYQHDTKPWVGNTPPAQKIIFYPVNKKPEPRLKFIRGSHRYMLNRMDFDAHVIANFETETLFSDNNKVLLFDTSILHGVIPDTTVEGSIRVIYNFVTEEQYALKYAGKDHHRNLHDLYLKRLNQ